MNTITKAEIEKILLSNDMLFNQIYVFQHDFDIIPKKMHFGAAINHIDIKECRKGFIDELINTITDWVYSQSKSEKLLDDFIKRGRSYANAFSEIQRSAFQKFRISEDEILVQGQLGELLLFCFLQKFFRAVPLLRKMPLTTSNMHERFGADAIHYKFDNNKNIFYLGESKVYTSNYRFNAAFENALNSIIDSYEQLYNELNLYIYEDFLDDKLVEIARQYKEATLENTEVHLVNFIMYNETNEINGESEQEIKNNIIEIIKDRCKKFDNNKIDINNNTILKRMTYIIFPVWKITELTKIFSKKIGG